MILEGILGVAVLCFFAFLSMKLYDQWKLKKLRQKYPEGTETVSKPVEKMGRIERKDFAEKITEAAPKLEIDKDQVVDNLKEDLINDKSKAE